MPINNPFVSTIDIQDSQGDVRIEMLSERPVSNKKFRPLRAPGQLAGYYSVATDTVELFMVSASGELWIRIV